MDSTLLTLNTVILSSAVTSESSSCVDLISLLDKHPYLGTIIHLFIGLSTVYVTGRFLFYRDDVIGNFFIDLIDCFKNKDYGYGIINVMLFLPVLLFCFFFGLLTTVFPFMYFLFYNN